ncbi:flagellar motor protein PomA [Methylophaga sp. OBS1]|uniref:flagellar motor protein PomA n=1 Tax=Methylophaga sp. OBS1 TaxID=2991933 RepID=UPI00225A368A|nr:flagellar motor protein PomA [Methylophaga sp. OBS1]MCX4190985.1 flagellar motor protein PomA [Methylophaga sp. OBS1]MCX4192069.1 flagellar motor protein PomA [Methylophaga sp. OBS1]
MDLATLLGLVTAWGLIIATIALGAAAGTFVNMPSLAIVLGGTFAVVLMRFTLGQFIGSIKTATKAFLHKSESPQAIIDNVVELAGIARKEGLLALERQEISNPVLSKGIMMLVDGHEPAVVKKALLTELNETLNRHSVGQQIFKAMGDAAPAMGMIGTLVGLVQMLSNMSDPKSIGPAMAVALLTTLYGAMLANMFALPIADKLSLRSSEELMNKNIIIESVLGIQEGQNPKILGEILKNFLPASKRDSEEEAAA